MNGTNRRTERVKRRLALRHEPQQDRSRVRLQSLLDAAGEVIAESGLQGLAMREVARRADLPIASVYHYFPSTTALVRALVQQQLEKLSDVLKRGLRTHLSMDGREFNFEALGSLIDEVAAYFFNTPSASEIWAGLHAYPDLRALNIEDTKRNASELQPYIAHFFPSLEPEQATMTAIVLVEWVSATLRFATASPPANRTGIVEALKTLVAQSLMGFLQTPEGARPNRTNPLKKKPRALATTAGQRKKPAGRLGSRHP